VLNFRASLKKIKLASLSDYEFSLSADCRISSNAYEFFKADKSPASALKFAERIARHSIFVLY